MPPGAPMSSKNWTLVAAVLGSSIVFLDSAVLTVALPAIGHEPRLFVDVLEAQNYIQYGYLLTLSSLLILAGALSDFYGRRRMFVIGLVGFGVASLLCGLAPNLELLILARLVQGAAGALLVPGLAGHPDQQLRGRGAGPRVRHLGGRVRPRAHPRAVRRRPARRQLQLALDLPAQPAVHRSWPSGPRMRYVKESRDEQASGHFDWLGALLVALAVGGLQLRRDLRPAAPVAGSARVRRARRSARIAHHRAAVLLRAGRATRWCRCRCSGRATSASRTSRRC